MTTIADRERLEREMFVSLKRELPNLEALLVTVNSSWSYEDMVYRFYHQSFKVFGAQGLTLEIVGRLAALLPGQPLNEWFMTIVKDGTGKEFHLDANQNWLQETRPIIEAFLHAKFFLEMAVRYGKLLEEPQQWMSSGWAAFLYLYNIR